MPLNRDWEMSIQQWFSTMPKLFCEPLGTVPLKAPFTFDQYPLAQAKGKTFAPISIGHPWGAKWQYGWFKTSVCLPKEAAGKRIHFKSGVGSECAIFIDGKAHGAWDREHKEIALTKKGVPGKPYEIII